MLAAPILTARGSAGRACLRLGRLRRRLRLSPIGGDDVDDRQNGDKPDTEMARVLEAARDIAAARNLTLDEAVALVTQALRVGKAVDAGR